MQQSRSFVSSPSKHGSVDVEHCLGHSGPGVLLRLLSPAFPESGPQRFVIEKSHQCVSEIIPVSTMHHQCLALVFYYVAEAVDVGADDRRLAGHRFEECNAEGCLGGGTRVHRAVGVVAGSFAEHRADEGDVGISASGAVVMLPQWTVANDDELSTAVSPANFLERFDESGEAVARIKSAEKENDGNIGAQRGGAGDVRVEYVGIDSVWNDRPVGLEVSIERDRRL